MTGTNWLNFGYWLIDYYVSKYLLKSHFVYIYINTIYIKHKGYSTQTTQNELWET